MSVLFAALGIGIVSYIGFVLLFPKAIPEDSRDYVRTALDRLYQENRAAENEQLTVMRDQLLEQSAIVRMVLSLRFMRPIYEAGLQAGYMNQLHVLVIMMFASAGVTAFILLQMGFGFIGFLAALVVGYYLPYKHCIGKVRKRNHQFIDQFPDALDMIVRSVRSGFPLSIALQMLAENTEDPVRAEFRQVADEIALGRSLNQALSRLATRINEPDIRFFTVVLSVQQETGGNLGEIISNLSNVIRKRKQLRHKIRAMTSEGRATGIVLGLLPVFVFGALYFIQPGYIQPFFTDPMGQTMLGSVFVLMAMCFFIVKQMIDVDI
jgi:Flp pilus assembly protein TadB